MKYLRFVGFGGAVFRRSGDSDTAAGATALRFLLLPLEVADIV